MKKTSLFIKISMKIDKTYIINIIIYRESHFFTQFSNIILSFIVYDRIIKERMINDE